MAETVDEITTGLVAWIGSILPGVPAATQSLGARERKPGADLRLVWAAPRQVPRTPEQLSIVDLDYLVTVQMPNPSEEQRAVVELLFAAMDRPESDIVMDRNVAELCTTLGIPIAPGFVLRTPLYRAREAKSAPRVRAPLVVHTSELGAIVGRVVGPQDIPVAGATVSAAGLDRFARTDRDGHFRIAAAPAGGTGVRLVARARGAEIEGVAIAGQSVTLRLPLEV